MSLKEYIKFVVIGGIPIVIFISLSGYLLHLLNWTNTIAFVITSIIIVFPIFKYIDFLVDKDII